MAAHFVQPKLRALNEAVITNGLLKNMTSRGVTIQLAKESGGGLTKKVPKERIWIRGSVYTPA